MLLQGLAGGALALRGLDSNGLNGTGRVRVTAHLVAPRRIDAEVEKIVGRISLEPTISAARWEAQAARCREPIRAGPLKDMSQVRRGRRIAQIAAIQAERGSRRAITFVLGLRRAAERERSARIRPKP